MSTPQQCARCGATEVVPDAEVRARVRGHVELWSPEAAALWAAYGGGA